MVADHRLGFETLDHELGSVPLTVEGEMSPWLAGTLLRVGPAKFEVGTDRYRHWFDGLAMLHRFHIETGGSVSYSNRYVQSPAYRSAQASGRITYSEFATDPCRSWFRRIVTAFSPPRVGANTNVNVIRFGEEFVALTETPLPIVFDPATLATLGAGQPAPGQLTVAHPHRSPGSGELVSYATHFGMNTQYRVYARTSTARRVVATLPVRRPAYMHSFAITEHYVVLAEFPFVVLPAAIPLSGRPFIENFRWRPERGTRFRVVDLATGELVGSYTGPACFAFHHVNAYEHEAGLTVDLCAYDDPGAVQALYLDRLRQPHPRVPQPRLRRYTIPLAGGEVRSEQLCEVGLELPRIHYQRHNGRPYRYVYGVGSADGGGMPDRIVKVDVEHGTAAVWAEPGAYPGEPVFVPAPGDEREDSGVLLSVVLDSVARRSLLLVLNAADLTEVARATVPHSIPFGFHGSFHPGAA